MRDAITTVDPAHFRQVLAQVPTGVTVVTAAHPEGLAGLTVGAFFSVSLDPPLIGWCPAKTSSSWPRIEAAGSFCVNVLAHDQQEICRHFASKDSEKFAGIEWSPATSGSPRIHGALAWVDCDIEAVHDAGDHRLCLGHVRRLDIERHTSPLVFCQGNYGRITA